MRILLSCLLLFSGAALAESRFFDSNGVQIRFVERGAGAPVLLIHGFTGAIERSWDSERIRVLADLARDHRVIAFDLRGHGMSGKPHDPKAYEDIALDAVRLLDHLGIARAHVVGYSLGGIIIARLLVTHPERFLSAVMGGASHRRSQSAESDRAAEAAAAELESGLPYRTMILSVWPTKGPQATDAQIQEISARLVKDNDRFAHAALYRARRALVVRDADLAAVRVPTLAIVGDEDPALGRVRALERRWPALKVQVVEGATHTTAHERSLPGRPEFAAAIRAFIQAHAE